MGTVSVQYNVDIMFGVRIWVGIQVRVRQCKYDTESPMTWTVLVYLHSPISALAMQMNGVRVGIRHCHWALKVPLHRAETEAKPKKIKEK